MEGTAQVQRESPKEEETADKERDSPMKGVSQMEKRSPSRGELLYLGWRRQVRV